MQNPGNLVETTITTTDRSTWYFFGVSEESVTIFTWIVVAGVCQAIDICGIVTNIINIICFVKLGFIESVNVSLFGLAVCDLCCVVTQIVVNTGYTLNVAQAYLQFEEMDVIFVAAAMPHLSFTRVNCWITATITLERCLCITHPLKVKELFTTKRVWILISSIYIILILSGAPVYTVNRLGSTFSEAKNRTLLGLVSTSDKHRVEGITFVINSFLLPFIAFIIITTCTLILVVSLRRKAKWRQAVTTQTFISSREQKVAKMVVMIASLFIFCFIPISVNMLAIAFEPNLNIGGKYVNITKVSGNLGFLLESVNSSANIFIYYRMSRKYRDTFNVIFCRLSASTISKE